MDAPAPGVVVGRYTLVRRLAGGGMGEVWVGTDGEGTEVAVKVLPEGALADSTARARFAREVEAARAVRHPGVQGVLDADAEAERPWLATELVAGPTLAGQVGEAGPFDGAGLHALALGLAEALAAVHAAGVVHRDVTPANVVLGPDGPVLVDFGIAVVPDATTLTMTGTVVGTAGWLAPELLRDDEASDAADVWSWGLVLAYAATGRPPAAGSRAEVVLRRVLDGDLDVDGLPPWLDRLVRRAIEPTPARRPTADELVAALDPQRGFDLATAALEATSVAPVAATAAQPVAPVEAVPPTERRDRRPLALRAAVVAAGLGIGLVAEPLVVVLVATALVVAAIAVKVWSEERAEEKRPWVGGGTLVLAAATAAVTAAALVVGLLLAVIGFLGLIVLFFALGGDLS